MPNDCTLYTQRLIMNNNAPRRLQYAISLSVIITRRTFDDRLKYYAYIIISIIIYSLATSERRAHSRTDSQHTQYRLLYIHMTFHMTLQTRNRNRARYTWLDTRVAPKIASTAHHIVGARGVRQTRQRGMFVVWFENPQESGVRRDVRVHKGRQTKHIQTRWCIFLGNGIRQMWAPGIDNWVNWFLLLHSAITY